MSLPPILIAPAVGSMKARDHAQDRGLAAARRAEEREELARLDRHIGIVDGPEGAEVAADIFQINSRAHGRVVPLRSCSLFACRRTGNSPPIRHR
jgi:hypothetical protein